MTLNKLKKNFFLELTKKIHLSPQKALCNHWKFSFGKRLFRTDKTSILRPLIFTASLKTVRQRESVSSLGQK